MALSYGINLSRLINQTKGKAQYCMTGHEKKVAPCKESSECNLHF